MTDTIGNSVAGKSIRVSSEIHKEMREKAAQGDCTLTDLVERLWRERNPRLPVPPAVLTEDDLAVLDGFARMLARPKTDEDDLVVRLVRHAVKQRY